MTGYVWPGEQPGSDGGTHKQIVRLLMLSLFVAAVLLFLFNGVDLTIAAENGAPVVGSPAYTLGAPDPVSGAVRGQAHISDPDGDPISIVEIIQGVRNGAFAGDPSGNFSYTPELAARIRAGTGGEDAEHIVFTVSDGHNDPVTVTLDIPISPADMTVTRTFAAGPTNAMAVGPDGAHIYLANDDGSVVVVDPLGNLVASIEVGANPSALALSGNYLYVTNSGSDTVSVIDITNNSVIETIEVDDDPRGVAVNERSGHVYVSSYRSDTVTVIDAATLDVHHSIDLGPEPWEVAASFDGRYIYVATSFAEGGVWIIMTALDGDVLTVCPGFAAPIGLATGFHDGRSWLYVTNGNKDTVTVCDADFTLDRVGEVTVGPRPRNVVFSADGSIAYVSLNGEDGDPDNRVVAVDTRYLTLLDSDFEIDGVQPLTVGTSPRGMAFNPVTNQLYVINKGDGTISVIEMTRLNSAPTAPVVDVTPNSPGITDDLMCSIVTESTDAEGDTVSYSYAWYKDGVLQADLTTDTVSAANLALGQIWKCVVIPNDGTVDGPTAQDQVTVTDTSPPIVTPPIGRTAEATSSAGAWVTWETATATDDADGPLTAGSILYYLDYGTPGAQAITSPHLFPMGETSVTCTAADASGNIGAVAFKVTVTDTTPPAVSQLSAGFTSTLGGEGVLVRAIVSDLASLIAGTEYRLGSGPWLPMNPGDGRFDSQSEEVRVTLSGLAEGFYTVYVRVTDSAAPANTSSGGASAKFRVGGDPLPIPTFTLLYLFGEGGTVSGQSRQEVKYGYSGIEVTAVPDEGYEFVRWSDGLTTRSRSDRLVTGNLTVRAEFRLIPPPPTIDQWSDITDAQWLSYYGLEVKDVARMADGYADGTFRPFLPITRAQFTKMALAGLGLSTHLPGTNSFRDVPASHEYFGWAEGARKEGLISGYGDGTFRLGALITREQANTILGRYVVQKELAAHGHIEGSLGNYASLQAWFAAEGASVLARFVDAPRLAPVHAPYTAYLVYRGVVSGSESEGGLYLLPLADLVRAQAVALILRVDALI